MSDVGWLREVGGLMSERCLMSDVGCLSFAAFVSLLTSAIILLTCLLQEVIIEFDYSVAEGEAFILYSIGNLTHVRSIDVRWKM